MSRAGPAREESAHRRGRRSGLRGFFDVFLAVLILGLLALVAARLDRVDMRLTGKVAVNDGDTVTVRGERVRLRGVDAPEFNQSCTIDGRRYSCGRKAREALKALIGDRPVACSGWQRDRYHRLLAMCMAGSTELNRALVEQGWAVAFGDFEAEEHAARKAGRGLWAGEFDRPRQWRDKHGSLAEIDHDSLGGLLAWLGEFFAWADSPR